MPQCLKHGTRWSDDDLRDEQFGCPVCGPEDNPADEEEPDEDDFDDDDEDDYDDDDELDEDDEDLDKEDE